MSILGNYAILVDISINKMKNTKKPPKIVIRKQSATKSVGKVRQVLAEKGRKR